MGEKGRNLFGCSDIERINKFAAISKNKFPIRQSLACYKWSGNDSVAGDFKERGSET